MGEFTLTAFNLEYPFAEYELHAVKLCEAELSETGFVPLSDKLEAIEAVTNVDYEFIGPADVLTFTLDALCDSEDLFIIVDSIIQKHIAQCIEWKENHFETHPSLPHQT